VQISSLLPTIYDEIVQLKNNTELILAEVKEICALLG